MGSSDDTEGGWCCLRGPKVPKAPQSPSPWLAATLEGPSTAWTGRKATTIHYQGPELYNYHWRLSYFEKPLCCCQSCYSSKPKQDGKNPAQDAASGWGKVNPLRPCCPQQGVACTPSLQPASPQHQGGPCGFACTRAPSKGRFSRGRFGVIEVAECLPDMGWGWGSVLSSAAGSSDATCLNAFLHQCEKLLIFSYFSCNGSSFGSFPVQWLGQGMPARGKHLTAAPHTCPREKALKGRSQKSPQRTRRGDSQAGRLHFPVCEAAQQPRSWKLNQVFIERMSHILHTHSAP